MYLICKKDRHIYNKIKENERGIIVNIFLVFAFLFFVGSCIGWGMELPFRRFISSNNPRRKWINPGFLTGPYLPLYGFGLLGMYVIS